MQQKVAFEREYNMAYEKDLNKALDKYKPSFEKIGYPERPRHLEYKQVKPKEKRTIYE